MKYLLYHNYCGKITDYGCVIDESRMILASAKSILKKVNKEFKQCISE